jgi:hypothetical protein
LLFGKRKNWQANIASYKQYLTPEKYKQLSENQFLLSVLGALSDLKTQLLTSDLIRLDHWGKTPTQRVVLLDYGFTPEVQSQFY